MFLLSYILTHSMHTYANLIGSIILCVHVRVVF